MSTPPQATLGRRLPWRLDMVHSNPGDPLTISEFNNPRKLAEYGYTAQVVNDFMPPSTGLLYDSSDPGLFPPSSPERAWITATARRIDARTREIHAAGLKALYFTDFIVFPRALAERHQEQITDPEGNISIHRDKTRDLIRAMIAEMVARFPYLDGLVVRTGETYLHATPHHVGNNPITQGADSHRALLDVLREELCVRHGKTLVYRTWGFDGFERDPDYYLSVTDAIEPHPDLLFSIKHTATDYWRTVEFNKTLTLGRHQQLVEIQCQREYEGKGATPNYVLDGVLNGFEEFHDAPGPQGLNDIRHHPHLQGVFTWSRGGGWEGPDIPDELWCDLNTYVASQWALDVDAPEEALFDRFAKRLGITGDDRERFRELALLSATGVLHGHYSTIMPVNLTWTRDEYLGGSDLELADDFAQAHDEALTEALIAEKAEAAAVWRRIGELADSLTGVNHRRTEFIRTSSAYGTLLYQAIHHAWAVMLLGTSGDRTGHHDQDRIAEHLNAFDQTWSAYEDLRSRPGCAALYRPHGFRDPQTGLLASLDRYRHLT
ncbi:hypothetical protein ACXZ65_36475 [Streptomyces aculeolatus]